MTEEDLTTDHPQVLIHIYGGDIEVDEDIAELITLMNEADIETIMSCQDNDGGRGTVRRVWIDIYADDLRHFLEILNRPGELNDWESLSNRMAVEYVPDDWEDFAENREWHYKIDTPRVDGELVDPAVSIRFPYSDLAEVIARMHAVTRPHGLDTGQPDPAAASTVSTDKPDHPAPA